MDDTRHNEYHAICVNFAYKQSILHVLNVGNAGNGIGDIDFNPPLRPSSKAKGETGTRRAGAGF